MFENLSDKLQRVFKNLRGEGRLTELHLDEALKEGNQPHCDGHHCLSAKYVIALTSELLTYPWENLSAFCHLEKPATANRMRRSVPGKTVSVLLRVAQRAATACDR